MRQEKRKNTAESEVTQGLLKDYKSMKSEMAETRYRLEHLDDDGAMIGNDVIFDYSTGQPRPQSVVGYDSKRAEHLKSIYVNRMARLAKQMNMVEEYIDGLQSSISRRVMEMYFIQGMSQKYIANAVHKSQTKVSNIISAELSKLEE